MAENILEKIVKKKSEKIVNLKKTISVDSLDKLINTNKTFINFNIMPKKPSKGSTVARNLFRSFARATRSF